MSISNTKRVKLISSISLVIICSLAGSLFSLFIRFFLNKDDNAPLMQYVILGSITGFVLPATFLFLDPLLARFKKMPLWVCFFIQPFFLL